MFPEGRDSTSHGGKENKRPDGCRCTVSKIPKNENHCFFCDSPLHIRDNITDYEKKFTDIIGPRGKR